MQEYASDTYVKPDEGVGESGVIGGRSKSIFSAMVAACDLQPDSLRPRHPSPILTTTTTTITTITTVTSTTLLF